MAVTISDYRPMHDKQYKGLSTDQKPANAQINELFLELDTGDIYYYDGEDWQKIGGE